MNHAGNRAMHQALIDKRLGQRHRARLMLVMLLLACTSTMVDAQTPIFPAPVLPSPGLSNPLDRNPLNRSSVPDSAPVLQDARNSSTRPTLPAAPSSPDIRDAQKQPPDKTRDAQLPAPDLEPVKP